ncbi:MAG: S8 family serine peptidase [Clostridia bacterium]|nr:S8 family serine peptidase [Clostridia bacterium]
MKKKVLSLFLALAMAFILPAGAVAEEDKGEKITVIVELCGGAVLDAQKAQEMGFKLFSATEEAADIESEIRQEQKDVCEAINSGIDKDAAPAFTYTHVLNGFSMDVYESEIERIKALPEVLNVYISGTHEITEGENTGGTSESPGVDTCCEMIHADYMHSMGYTGKGMVIAIVDCGFDVNHEIFKGKTENPKLSKDDIADIIENVGLSTIAANGNVTADSVYRSEKIPYAFNYYENSTNMYDSGTNHGQHVAGIAAGNFGTNPAGEKYLSMASDAQLLLMGTGRGDGISDDAVLAAIDDAVKLGADVINASFGYDYFEICKAEEKAVNAAVKAGVLFSASAGNAARGFERNTPPPQLIDYSASGAPKVHNAATAVANVDNQMVWEKTDTMTADGKKVKFYDANEKASFKEKYSDREYEFVFVGYGSGKDFADVDVRGKIAVMGGSGKLSYQTRISNAAAAGAESMVFISPTSNYKIPISGTMMGSYSIATVSMDDGYIFKNANNCVLKTNAKIGLNDRGGAIMSKSSSWCTDSSLVLKPEITAPGGDIYSSVCDGEYEFMTGTSMAAPHMTGAAAMVKQYITGNPRKFKDVQNPVPLIENIIMTSADVLMQDTENEIPYSPRLQGAGLINLEKAVKTPVTLIGDKYDIEGFEFEKSKISLKEIGDSFTLRFKARSFSTEPVVYDKISITLMTDNVDENGLISDMRKLSFEAELPESVTVPAGGEAEIEIPVALCKDELDANMETFTNGFYVDGFVFLGSSDDAEIPEISIPFMGFYGGWGKQPMIDKPYFSGGNLSGKTYLCTETRFDFDGTFGAYEAAFRMGANSFIYERYDNYNEYCSEDYAGYSPNGDNEADYLGITFFPMRTMGKTDCVVFDANGEEVARQTLDEELEGRKFAQTVHSFKGDDFENLPDGDYTLELHTGFAGNDPYEQNVCETFKFYIDTEPPEITKFEINKEEKTLTVAAKDNRYMMGFILHGIKENGHEYMQVVRVKGISETECTVDISDFPDEETITVEALDYAHNIEYRSVRGISFELNSADQPTFLFAVDNKTGGDIKPTVILALYSGDKLVGISSKNDVIPEGESYYTFNLQSGVYDTVKIFTWDAMDGMKPLYKSFVFN